MSKTILIDFKATDNVSKTAKTVENSVKRVGAQSTTMGSQMATSSQKATKHLTDLGSQLRYMSLVAGLAAAGAIAVAKSFITAAKDMQDAQLKLGVYAVSSGVSMDAATQAAQKLYSTGLIPLTDASTALSNLLATGMGLEKATKLTDTFLNAIVVGKESINDTFGEALVKATLGVRIFQERQIDATGINTQLNQVYKEYGKTINVVTTSMTNAQKWQAIYNFSMREGTRFTGAAELASQTLSGTMSKLSANMTIMKATLGASLVPAFSALSDMLRNAAAGITNFAQKFPAMSSIIIVGVLALTLTTAALAGLGAIIPLVTTGVKGLGKIFKLLNATSALVAGKIILITLAVGALVWGVLKLTGYWDKSMNAMKNLSQKIMETINPMKKQSVAVTEMNKKLAKQLKDIQQNIFLATRDFQEGMRKWADAHDKTISELTTDIKKLDKEYAKATKHIKDNFSNAMSSLQTDHARKTEDIQRQLAEEVSKGVWADQTKIRDLQRELKRENEDYSASIAEKATERDNDLVEEKDTYDEKLAELKKKLEAELKLETDNAELVRDARLWPILDEVKERRRAFTERITQLEDELAEANKTAAAEIASNGDISNSSNNMTTTATEAISKQKKLQTEINKTAERARVLSTSAGQAGLVLKLTVQELIDKYITLGQKIYEAGLKADGVWGKIIDTLGGNMNRNLSEIGTFMRTTVPDFFSGLLGSDSAPSASASSAPANQSPALASAQTPARIKFPTNSLSFGSSGSTVSQLQQWLNKNGYSVGSVDGKYGNATKNAVAQLQSSLGTTADGSYGPNTISKLLSKRPSGYRLGGVIPGSANTPVPIIAHGGETVLPAGVAPVTININNPTVRDDSDIKKIADAVSAVLSSRQSFRHIM